MVFEMNVNSMNNNSRKVVMVTPYWFPIMGGVTSYVSNLVKILQKNKNGFSMRIIGSVGESDDDALIISNNIIFFILKTFLFLCKEKSYQSSDGTTN